jgi:iron(III) transport system substrate-binding protein
MSFLSDVYTHGGDTSVTTLSSTKRSLHRRSAIGALVAMSLVAAACGGDDEPAGEDAPDTTEAPDTDDAPDTTEAPDTDDAPDTTEAPDTTDAPEPPASDVSGTLTWLTVFSLDETDAFISAFNEQYPDVNVEVVRADSSGVIERFTTENETENYSSDVVTIGLPGVFNGFAAQGWVQPYEAAEASAFPPDAVAEDFSWYSPAAIISGTCWNTDVLADEGLEPPASWDEMGDPKYDGLLTMQDILRVGSGGHANLQRLYFYWDDEERWQTMMEGMAANGIVFQPGYIEAQSALVAGEFGIMPICLSSFIKPFIDEGAPVVWAPLDPVVRVNTGWGISTNAPNLPAAQAFTDFMTTLDGQNALTSAGNFASREDADLPPGFTAEDFANVTIIAGDNSNLSQEAVDAFNKALEDAGNGITDEFSQRYIDIFGLSG